MSGYTLGHILQATLLVGMVLLGTSCTTPNVNPPQAKAHRGYVDFYSPGQTNLYWSVKRLEPETDEFKTLFSRLKSLPDGVLRLELEPGPQRFQITFLNRLIEAPLTLQVPVQQAMVTPVKVELVPIGETSVQREEEQLGANVRRSGRKTRYSSQAGALERLVASVQPAAPYQPKQQTSHPP